MKEVTVNYAKRWFNESLKQMRIQKNNLHLRARMLDTPDSWSEFKTVKNQYTKELNKAKNCDNRETVQKLRHDPKKLWRYLKNINKETNTKIDQVIIDSVVINDPAVMVEELNEFFVQSITHLNNSIPSRPFTDTPCSYSMFSEFELLDEARLQGVMRSIVKKSGIDNVNINVLSHAMNTLGEQFLCIINTSLRSGQCPASWRKTIVTPITKVPRAKKCEELRPINTIPVADKVLQCVVREQLQSHRQK